MWTARLIKKLIEFARTSLEPKGQINQTSEIGRWITTLSSLSQVNFIVEVGTWTGEGSTECIIRGGVV